MLRSRLADMDAELAIAVDDRRIPDVRALLERHLAFSHEVTPNGHVHCRRRPTFR